MEVGTKYARGVAALGFVFRLDEPTTLDDLENVWFPATIPSGDESRPCLLIGTFADQPRVVPISSVYEFCRKVRKKLFD